MVPEAAVLSDQSRKLVLVQLGEGRFEPREVKIGARSDNYAQVLQGVKEGEQVVVSANFLIDAESNLKAAVGGLGGAPAQGTAANAPARAASASQQAGQAAAGIGHRASGTVEGIDARTGAITLNHDGSEIMYTILGVAVLALGHDLNRRATN